jgi:hypothetical protein
MPTSREPHEFDVICVGTSPLMIIEALHQAEGGKRTLLIDAADRCGGAWSEFQVFGLTHVEISPHFIRYDETAYNYLRNVVGLSLEPMPTGPAYLVQTPFCPVWIPYSVTPWINLLAAPLYCLRRSRSLLSWSDLSTSLQRWKASLKSVYRQVVTGQKQICLYPPGGTLQLMNQLLAAVAQSAVTIQTRQRLESVQKDSDGELCCLVGGRELKTKRLFTTEHQQICATSAAAATAAHRSEPHDYFDNKQHTSLHLLVKTDSPPPSSFVLAKRNTLFNLLSDLTTYTPQVLAGHRLLAVRLIKNDHPDPRRMAISVIQ